MDMTRESKLWPSAFMKAVMIIASVACFMGINMSFAHQIEVFSIQSLPVQADGMDVQVCWLDEIKRVQEQLSDISQDIGAIQNRIKEKEGTLIKAMDCQFRAGLYGIQKLPAIVIDKKYLAYGEHSVSRALDSLNDEGKTNA